MSLGTPSVPRPDSAHHYGSTHAGPPSEFGIAGDGGHGDPAALVTEQSDFHPEVQIGRRQDPRSTAANDAAGCSLAAHWPLTGR
jgi:hypothetical protein